MATNILSLTKVENQTILTDVKEYNLSEQIRHSILVLEKKWTKKDLEICADFLEFMINGDQDLLKQVWLNLLDNAIKFSPAGGTVTVRLKRKPHTLEVSIINHGPKIQEVEVKRLFDKFWQGDTSHASEGTGVGLSIVRKIVELHKGIVQVSSTEAETIFTVLLPVKQAE